MDINTRIETQEWIDPRDTCVSTLRQTNQYSNILEAVNTAMVRAYQLGRVDGGADGAFLKDAKSASVELAEILCAFRQKLVTDGGMTAGVGDLITRDHHMAIFQQTMFERINQANKEMSDGA